MVKKYLIIIMMLFSLFITGYSADAVVTQCPVSTLNDTTYILDPTFNVNSAPCFDLTNTQNVIIDGNNTDFRGSGYLNIVVGGNSVSGIIQNLIWDDFRVTFSGQSNDITLQDSFIENGHSFSYTGIGSGIPNTNGADSIFYFSGSQPSTSVIQNNIKIYRNRFYSDSGLFPSQRDNYNLFYLPSQSALYYDIDFDIDQNDFIGFGLTGRNLQNNGGDIGTASLKPALFSFTNNIYLRSNSVLLYISVDDTNYGCGGFNIASSNLLSSENAIDLPSADGVSDNTITINSNSCTLLNSNPRTTKILNNQQFITDKQEIATMTPLFFGTNVLYDDSRYFLGKQITLNSTQQWSFSSVQDSILDLSLFNDRVSMYLETPRTILMGNNNEIQGDSVNLPIIETQGVISVNDAGFFGNNWHLIEYDNGLTIDGVNFDLNAVDNYGLIRKRADTVDGISLTFKNNIFDLNFVPATPLRPLILGGSFMDIENNQFDLLSTVNVSLLGDGTSSSLSGGHLIIDNTFNGGGYIFQELKQETTDISSKFIHNEFRKVGSLYSYPFNPSQDFNTQLTSPQVNGSYFYKTTCTNYEFNVGNYYEFWDDLGYYNDSNGDGIHDEFNVPVFGVIDYVPVGFDSGNNSINDFRSVVPYPFNFAGQTGNAISTTDTCVSFQYNVNSPIQNNNYTSGTNLVSDWEFISIGFPSMTCFETVNGFTTIYQDINSGDNQGVQYDTTDGKGVFSVKCCDNDQCNNFVKETEPVEFCIGDCNLGNLIVSGISTPTVINGCTDSGADNYNPSATNDDGSCTFNNGSGGSGVGSGNGVQTSGDFAVTGLFSTDIDSGSDSVVGLFSLAETPLGYGIMFGFIAIFLSLLTLLFAFARRMIS